MNTNYENVLRGSRDNPEIAPVVPSTVHDIAPVPDRPTASPRECLVAVSYVNGARNSRVTFVAPKPDLVLKSVWSKPLDAPLRPVNLMAAGDRVYLLGQLSWALFDLEGKQIAAGARGRGEACLDAERRLLYQPSHTGTLEGISIEDGTVRFRASLYMAGDFYRPYINRAGNSLIVQGVEIRLPGTENPHEPELSSVETWPVDEPLDVGTTGQIAASVVKPLIFVTTELVAAMNDDSVVMAEPNRVVVADSDLQVFAVIKGSFKPLTVSLDEAGWMYLIVDEGKQSSLWVLNLQGERMVSLPVPVPSSPDGYMPPIVGYDHCIYVPVKGGICVIDTAGKLAGELKTTAFAGAVVTSDNKLMVADGADLLVFEADGRKRILRTFDGETLLAAPAITQDGHICVATDKNLYSMKLVE